MSVRAFLWACLFLTLVLVVLAMLGGLVMGPIVYALTLGTPWPLLLVLLGIPGTVGAIAGAWVACGRMIGELE